MFESFGNSTTMTIIKKKIVFYSVWALLILVGLYTIKINTNFSIAFISRSATANFFQRFFGVILYILLFVQVVLLINLEKWVLKFYVFNGVLIFLAILGRTFSLILFNYFLWQKMDPMFAYFDVCLLCKTTADYFYTIGRIEFWLIAITVLTSFKLHWQKFQELYYLAFLLDGAYEYFFVADFITKPFFYFAVLAYFTVLAIVLFKEIPKLYKNFRIWFN